MALLIDKLNKASSCYECRLCVLKGVYSKDKPFDIVFQHTCVVDDRNVEAYQHDTRTTCPARAVKHVEPVGEYVVDKRFGEKYSAIAKHHARKEMAYKLADYLMAETEIEESERDWPEQSATIYRMRMDLIVPIEKPPLVVDVPQSR